VGPRNHVLDGGQHPAREGAIMRGKGRPIVKYRDALRSYVQKRLTYGDAVWVVGVDWPQES